MHNFSRRERLRPLALSKKSCHSSAGKVLMKHLLHPKIEGTYHIQESLSHTLNALLKQKAALIKLHWPPNMGFTYREPWFSSLLPYSLGQRPGYGRPWGSWGKKAYIGHYIVNDYGRTVVALYGLWFLLLVGVALLAALVKKHNNVAAFAIFKIYKFWLAIVLSFLYEFSPSFSPLVQLNLHRDRYYGFLFASTLVRQNHREVAFAFFIVETIFDYLKYPAAVCLLSTIYGLLAQLIQRPGTNYQKYRSLLWVHYALCFVLLALSTTIVGLNLRVLYTMVFDYNNVAFLVGNTVDQYVLNIVFDGLYTCAAFEILVTSIVLLRSRDHRDINKNVSRLPPLSLYRGEDANHMHRSYSSLDSSSRFPSLAPTCTLSATMPLTKSSPQSICLTSGTSTLVTSP